MKPVAVIWFTFNAYLTTVSFLRAEMQSRNGRCEEEYLIALLTRVNQILLHPAMYHPVE